MNFDKFKDIDMPDIQVNTDPEYLKKINKLPYRKQKGRILSAVGTVAAAVIIVLAVGLWAIIGRGVRIGLPTPTPPGTAKGNVILTDVTEWFEDISYQHLKESTNGKEPIPSIKSMPESKEFEFLSKKYNLKLKRAFYQGMTFPLYQYTDGNGTSFLFTENGELTEYEFSGISEKTGTVTKDEATKIAKDFAKQMFGEQFDEYTFNSVTEIGPSGPTEEYIVLFSKKYGKDNYLNGESCSVEVKINGDVIKCGIRSLYEFKKRDMSIFENITEADINKMTLSTFSQTDDHYNYTIERASISFTKGKNLIAVGVLMSSQDGVSAGLMRYFEVTIE